MKPEYREGRNYPTVLLKPNKQSRIVREVVWVEMEHLANYRKVPDIVATMWNICTMAKHFKELEYNIPELLSAYQCLDPNRRSMDLCFGITPEMIPWELVPEYLVLRCLDDDMNLIVTDELLVHLGLKHSSSTSSKKRKDDKPRSIFDTVEYTKRYVSKDKAIKSPVFDSEGRVVKNNYYFYDEKIGDFRKAVVGYVYTNRDYHELDFVVEMFQGAYDKNWRNPIGLTGSFMNRTIRSLARYALIYRKEYYKQSYLERLIENSPEELRKERMKDEKEFAISRNQTYCENTAVLWKHK